MTGFRALLNQERRLAWRHGCWLGAAIFALVWAALLTLVPMDRRGLALGLIAGLDVTAVGLLFGFGLGLLDQQRGMAVAGRLSPVSDAALIGARWLTLTGLLLASLILMAGLTVPIDHWLPRLPGLTLLSLQAAALGLLMGRVSRGINDFMLLMLLSAPLWPAPFLGYLDGLTGFWVWLWPLSGGLYWLRPGNLVTTGPLLVITGVQIGWIALTLWLTHRLSARRLGHRLGDDS